MSMKFRRFLCFLTVLLLISGCAGKEDGKKYPSEYEPSPSPKMSELRLPSSPGEQVAVDSSGLVQIDYSNTSSGYLQAKLLHKPEKRMRLQITKDGVGNIAYDFTKENEYETFPFEQGSGTYLVKVLENRSGKTYTITLTLSVDVKLENERIPFLYPNQTVNYDSHTAAVKKPLI